MVSFKFLVLGIAGTAAAFPQPTAAPDLEKRANCAKVTGALSVLKKLGPPATSFCSSYLKVPGAKTSTTTVTPVTTATTSTTTVTVTSSECPRVVNPGPDSQRGRKRNADYHSAEPEVAAAADLEKRTDVLKLLAAFAAAKVSEGCSCLSISPKVTTTTTATAATSVSFLPL
ncbi:Nn.00g003440.m01.CDS01 [Neocucurbitaria sp. VM-36]